jgi:hypothetical protein
MQSALLWVWPQLAPLQSALLRALQLHERLPATL